MSTTTAPTKKKRLPKLTLFPHKTPLGCDPELFISNGKHVVGSERAIPDAGMPTNYGEGRIIQDGVQVEFNPRPETCRAYMGNALSAQFKALKAKLATTGFKIDLTQVVRVPEEELAKLSEKSRRLGCAPSSHQYGETVDMTLTKANNNLRSAGGHIHISTTCDPNDLIPVLDLFVGNTCVLIDRDPMQSERRKLYGRAGEFRKPSYGIEYRTLSNFWLRSYQLMTLVFGLTRAANSIVYKATKLALGSSDYNGYKANELDREAYAFLRNKIDTVKLQAAINQNDFDLAMENYDILREFILTYIPSPDEYSAVSDSVYPLWPKALRWWRYFVKMGLDHWFPQDPMTHWCNLGDGHRRGWEAFLVNTVKPQYLAANEKKKA